jgi:RNA polymerase sigma factor (sigma-70 family)
MQTRTDADLIQEYAAHGSEAAFGEIVRRYADFVYSAALRQLGNAEQARDVAQTVFADLARKAGSLRANTLLIGWLCQGARLAALEQLRKEQRRQQRERQAMDLLDPSPDDPNDWNTVRPVLDEAIASLGHEDRDALLLRFFRNESLAAVGATLGVSEDAAQKRVSRALDKLREFLAERGIRTTAAVLSAVLTAHAVQSAPAGFAALLTSGALAKAAAARGFTALFLKLMTLSNMKTSILILALAGGVAGLIVLQANTQRQLREARALNQLQTTEMDALRAANAQLAGLTNEFERLRNEAKDVLRLRDEVSRLRRDRNGQQAIMTPKPVLLETNGVTGPTEPQVNIATKFVMIPTEKLRALLIAAGQTSLPGMAQDWTGLLTAQQFKVLGDALEHVEDSKLLASPQVTTLSGRQAQLQMMKEIPFGTGSTNIGLALDVIPQCTTNSALIQLSLTGWLAELTDASPGHDGSQPAVRHTVITNTSAVTDGMTVLLQHEIPADGRLGLDEADSGDNNLAGPKTLLVFVTPRAIKSDGAPFFPDRLVVVRRDLGGVAESDGTPFIQEVEVTNKSTRLVPLEPAPAGNP